ncbi:hypothetical protein BHE74_00058196, partial [Ensete ventricosum]
MRMDVWMMRRVEEKVGPDDLLAEDVLDDEAVAGDAGDDLGHGGGVEVEVLHVLPQDRLQVSRSHTHGLSVPRPRPTVSFCDHHSHRQPTKRTESEGRERLGVVCVYLRNTSRRPTATGTRSRENSGEEGSVRRLRYRCRSREKKRRESNFVDVVDEMSGGGGAVAEVVHDAGGDEENEGRREAGPGGADEPHSHQPHVRGICMHED